MWELSLICSGVRGKSWPVVLRDSMSKAMTSGLPGTVLVETVPKDVGIDSAVPHRRTFRSHSLARFEAHGSRGPDVLLGDVVCGEITAVGFGEGVFQRPKFGHGEARVREECAMSELRTPPFCLRVGSMTA